MPRVPVFDVFEAPPRVLADLVAVLRVVLFRVVERVVVFFAVPDLAFVDLLAVVLAVVRLAPVFALVDLLAVDRDAVFLAPVLALVDLLAVDRVVVFLAPDLAFVDLEAVRFAEPPLALVDFVALFAVLPDFLVVRFAVVLVAMSIGSLLNQWWAPIHLTAASLRYSIEKSKRIEKLLVQPFVRAKRQTTYCE